MLEQYSPDHRYPALEGIKIGDVGVDPLIGKIFHQYTMQDMIAQCIPKIYEQF
jgi:hypothetical protein